MKDKVLVINTGGTIGMVHSEKGNSLSPLRPAKDWHEIAKAHPILNDFPTDYYQFEPLIDSSDMSPIVWKQIAEVIDANYDKYRGFVVLHGTDTMAYTSSALSFMLKNLGKPVILTGSQVPLEKQRSDALQNLVTAIQIAGNEMYGVRNVPEVAIFFRDALFRGNRVRKMDAKNYFGFSTPNYPVLAEAGGDLKVKKKRLLKNSEEKFYIDTNIEENVMVLEIFPGMNPSYIKKFFEVNDTIRGVVLKSYGNGNAPTNDAFIDVINYITSKGIVVVNITQCTTGTVKMGLYEASARLVDAGVVSGLDLTPEAAVTKLMHLLGKTTNVRDVKRLMQLDICGEQTLNYYNYKYVVEEARDQVEFHFDIPEKLKSDDLVEAVIRIKGLEIEGEGELRLALDIHGENPIENLEELESKRVVVKDTKNLDDAILLNFSSCTKRIIHHCKKIVVKIDSNMKIKKGKVSFSIYSEN